MNNIQSTESKIQKIFSTISDITDKYYNRITFVSSFEDFDETLSSYLITIKNKHVNFKKAFQNSLKLYKNYVNNFDEIDQNSQIKLLFINNKLFLNAVVFFVYLTSLLVIRLLSCYF